MKAHFHHIRGKHNRLVNHTIQVIQTLKIITIITCHDFDVLSATFMT